jgi:alpha-glucosidase
VWDIPLDEIQDPQWERNLRVNKGRDGCRVPLPWTSAGSSFGFGTGSSHLPQPSWFANYSVEAESGDALSTLELYRRAVSARKRLISGEDFSWGSIDGAQVIDFDRGNGWRSITNFGAQPVALPSGEVVVVSSPLVDGKLDTDATAWVVTN